MTTEAVQLNGGYKYASKDEMLEANKARMREKYHNNKEFYAEKQRKYRAIKKQERRVQEFRDLAELAYRWDTNTREQQIKYLQQHSEHLATIYPNNNFRIKLEIELLKLRQMVNELNDNISNLQSAFHSTSIQPIPQNVVQGPPMQMTIEEASNVVVDESQIISLLNNGVVRCPRP